MALEAAEARIAALVAHRGVRAGLVLEHAAVRPLRGVRVPRRVRRWRVRSDAAPFRVAPETLLGLAGPLVAPSETGERGHTYVIHKHMWCASQSSPTRRFHLSRAGRVYLCAAGWACPARGRRSWHAHSCCSPAPLASLRLARCTDASTCAGSAAVVVHPLPAGPQHRRGVCKRAQPARDAHEPAGDRAGRAFGLQGPAQNRGVCVAQNPRPRLRLPDTPAALMRSQT